jgi:hypothetical protein
MVALECAQMRSNVLELPNPKINSKSNGSSWVVYLFVMKGNEAYAMERSLFAGFDQFGDSFRCPFIGEGQTLDKCP